MPPDTLDLDTVNFSELLMAVEPIAAAARRLAKFSPLGLGWFGSEMTMGLAQQMLDFLHLLEHRGLTKGCYYPKGGTPEKAEAALCLHDLEMEIQDGARWIYKLADPENWTEDIRENSGFGMSRERFADMLEATAEYLRLAVASEPTSSSLDPIKNRPPQTPDSRLTIDGNNVFLDGRMVCLDMTAEKRAEALCFLQCLLDARGWMSSSDVESTERGEKYKGTRWDRLRKSLPEEIQALIISDRRKGYRLVTLGLHK
ncbi:hypothetical protein AYO40_03075 [Planctomycetaceae bacterium SCGC AG-212-D15]|nr:hypothetical protein AYO40_03075 [Planctomycetaceae bacterium SCGC AG-212-D15]